MLIHYRSFPAAHKTGPKGPVIARLADHRINKKRLAALEKPATGESLP